MDKRSMELPPLEHIDALEGALPLLKNDWPFAKTGINLEAVRSRFEGILGSSIWNVSLGTLIARKAMQDASFQVLTVHPPLFLAPYARHFRGIESPDHLVPERHGSGFQLFAGSRILVPVPHA